MTVETHQDASATLEKWRARQKENLEWRERYFAVKEELDVLLKTKAATEETGGSADYAEELARLKEENEALRVKSEVLLDALENERGLGATRGRTPGMRQVQSMRGPLFVAPSL
jgi:hypothetical protein